MSSNLLFVPYRKTSKILFGEQLKQIIDEEYYQTSTIFQNDLNEIDTLRNDTIELEVSTQDLALLKRYFLHLSTLEYKFPVDVVEFPWFGTIGYNVSGPVKLKSLLFERINVLYNIAALFTQLGVNEDRTTGDGLKKCCIYFQYAASYFKLINKLAANSTTIQLPLDLQTGTITTLETLCLAQAQEIFWQKANSDNFKDSVISKLANQVSEYYSQALALATKSEGIRTEWIHHITVKKAHFEAVAQFRSSIIAVSNSKYGEEVARLETAKQIIESVSSNLKFVNEIVASEFNGLKSAVLDTLKQAEKDNDLIYLQPVPKKLAPITKLSGVKEMDISDIETPFKTIAKGGFGKLLFKDLLPFKVIQISQAFKERQEGYLNDHLVTPIKALNNIIDRVVMERDITNSIEKYTGGGRNSKKVEIPEILIGYNEEIKSSGGIKSLVATINDISKLSSDSKDLIEGCKERLRIENEEDELLRFKQGAKHWNRPSSNEAGALLLKRIYELENYQKQAKTGDEHIIQQFYEIENDLKILGSENVNDIGKYLPSPQENNNGMVDPHIRNIVNELKELMNKIRLMKLERTNFIENIEMKSMQNNILPKIISEYKLIQLNTDENNSNGNSLDSTKFEQVYAQHLKVFDKDIEWINKQKQLQKDIENKLEVKSKELKKFDKSTKVNDEYELKIKQFNSVYMKFKELVFNLSQGLKFYNDLINNCNAMIQDCDEFVYKRRCEARDLEQELNSRFSSPEAEPQQQQQQQPEIKAPKAVSLNKLPNPRTWAEGSDIKFS